MDWKALWAAAVEILNALREGDGQWPRRQGYGFGDDKLDRYKLRALFCNQDGRQAAGEIFI
jgi:hypothetical protein